MKPLEFRAWCPSFGMMIYSGNKYYVIDIAGCVTHMSENEMPMRAEREPIITQFTGMYDRKKKKIFDGDFVNFTAGHVEWIGEVKYYPTKGAYNLEIIASANKLLNFNTNPVYIGFIQEQYFSNDSPTTVLLSMNTEIIGNIFENNYTEFAKKENKYDIVAK